MESRVGGKRGREEGGGSVGEHSSKFKASPFACTIVT